MRGFGRAAYSGQQVDASLQGPLKNLKTVQRILGCAVRFRLTIHAGNLRADSQLLQS
jgi:hypothetical protein